MFKEIETRVFKGSLSYFLESGEKITKTVYLPQYKLNSCWMNFKKDNSLVPFDTHNEAQDYINKKREEAIK